MFSIFTSHDYENVTIDYYNSTAKLKPNSITLACSELVRSWLYTTLNAQLVTNGASSRLKAHSHCARQRALTRVNVR